MSSQSANAVVLMANAAIMARSQSRKRMSCARLIGDSLRSLAADVSHESIPP